MTQPLKEKIAHLQKIIVGYIASYIIYYGYTVLYTLLLGYFTVYKSDLTNNDKVLYCIECFEPKGYYLKWNADPNTMSVTFYVSPQQKCIF